MHLSIKLVFNVILILILLPIKTDAQRIENHLNLGGTVLGYTYDPSKNLFKKKNTIELEGSLSDVSIEIQQQGKTIIETSTGDGGRFQEKLELNHTYIFTYTKEGYGVSAFEIDLTGIPKDIAEVGLVLSNVELILNNYESNKPQDNGVSFGRIYFNVSKERFEFRPARFAQRKRLFKKEEDNTALNLMRSALAKNNDVNRGLQPVDETENPKKSNRSYRRIINEEGVVEDSVLVETVNDSHSRSWKEKVVKPFKGFKKLTSDDLAERSAEIKAAWIQLEKDRKAAVTEYDFLLIEAQEELLRLAEKELENAEMYIDEQESRLTAQQNFIYAAIGIILLLLALGGLLWYALKEKRATNMLLASKNRKITDSIRYAHKIQQSVLLTESQIKKLLPKSFVYYQPLDVVSGDFYWFSKINDKIMIAAVDCTGHGVPGAFMSLIGNTLLNQIVNENRLTQPSVILTQLHEGIVKALRQTTDRESAQDGMDLSLCCFDQSTGDLVFSGAMNSIYVVKDGEIEVLSGELRGIGGIMGRREKILFSDHHVKLSEGDSIYLYSDGFMDQFGGPEDEKFNISRFKELILSLQNESFDNQSEKMHVAFEEWRGDTPQTDDVLIIGIGV